MTIEGNSFRALGSWHRSRLFNKVQKCVLMCHFDQDCLEIARAQLRCLQNFFLNPFHGTPISVISISGVTLRPEELLRFIRLIDQAGCRKASIATGISDKYAFPPALEPALDSIALSHLRSLDIDHDSMCRTEWSTLLPRITITNLHRLALRGNFTSLSLARFLLRHPHVAELESNASWSHGDCMQSSAMPRRFLEMRQLKFIDGPPSHILAIMKSLSDIPYELEISTVPEPRMSYHDYILDILSIARVCYPTTKIQIRIPSYYHEKHRTTLTEAQIVALRNANASALRIVELMLPPIGENDIVVRNISSLS